MPSYTTRVELHSASYQDYERLHAAMEQAGFSRTIRSDQGVRYQLPTAEYDCTADGIDGVLNAAQQAATTTGCGHAILVSEAPRRSWIGLPTV